MAQLGNYQPGSSLAGSDFWRAVTSGGLTPMQGNPNEYDVGNGYSFIPKYKEYEGDHGSTVRDFNGGTLYQIQGKGDYKTPGYVYDAQGNPTDPGFQIEHKAPSFMDKYGFLVPLAAPFAAAAAGVGGAAGAGAGAMDLGGGLFMTADGAIVGATGAFAPATAAEMGAMGLGGVGSAGAGAAGLAGAAGGGGSGLTSAAGGAGNAASALGGSGAFDWSKLIGPGLSAVGGITGASAAKDAAGIQAAAADKAAALSEPWRQAGMQGLNRLTDLLGVSGRTGADGYGSAAKTFGMSDFQQDPGYAFRQQQGEQGLTRAAAANGSLGSGKYLKDAMNFNSGLASQEYGNAFNRFQTNRASVLNPLQSLSGVGQTAAGTIGEYGTQGANAQAAGKVGSANALTNALTQGYGMYQASKQQDENNSLMNLLLRRGM